MATHQPSQYYRKVVRTKALQTIERLILSVKEFKEFTEMRYAALTALRALLHLVASREEHIVHIQWPQKLIDNIMDGFDDRYTEKGNGTLYYCFINKNRTENRYFLFAAGV